jgi:hypothetical protein
MSPRYRILIFTIFALLFVGITPFLIFYSTGYNYDQGKVVRTLSISTSTFPSGANVELYNKKIGSTPKEFQATEGQSFTLDINKGGFVTESFSLWSPSDEPATARLTNIWLLPKDADNVDKAENNDTFLGFLPISRMLIKSNDSYVITTVNASGVENSREKISSPQGLDIKEGNWIQLTNTSFWNKTQRLLIDKADNSWRVYDISDLNIGVEELVSVGDNTYWVLTADKKLWLYSPKEPLIFLANEIEGIFSMDVPDTLWVWRADSLYRIDRYQPNSYLDLNNFVFQNALLLDIKTDGKQSNLQVLPLFQGFAVRFGDEAWYLPDLNAEAVKIATNAKVLGSSNELFLWIDDNKVLHSLNYILQRERTYGALDIDMEKPVEIFYYSDWKRVMVYADNRVYSAWLDKNYANDFVQQYNAVSWVEKRCMPEVVNRVQYCQDTTSFSAYKNARWW